MNDKGQNQEKRITSAQDQSTHSTDFVLEKNIFSNVFEKDIRRVYIYKKAERLAKAIHLITPAFSAAPSLRDRAHLVAIGLVDAAILPPTSARDQLSRELLTLSSMLSIARSSGLLSEMNANLIAREAQTLLQEVAAYEEPRLFLDDAPTLAYIAKEAPRPESRPRHASTVTARPHKGHIKDIQGHSDRKESILAVIKDKGQAYIKDISLVVRGVSEKTIQRELKALVASGVVRKEGERRWTLYSLA